MYDSDTPISYQGHLYCMTYVQTVRISLFCLFLIVTTILSGVVVADDLTVHFIDVGEGDAIFIEQGNATMLVDAGPVNAAEYLLSYLESLGIEKINTILTTHPDPAHIGGMPSVLNRFSADRYLDNGEEDGNGAHAALIQAVTVAGVPYEKVLSGSEIPFSEDITIDVLSPVRVSGDLNHDSLVLKFAYGNTTFLLMGGADKEAEQQILRNERGDITILTISDHGDAAATSEEFIQEMNPDVAVIMVGKGNPYGHPALETLRTLNDAGVHQIYQTMNDGTIIITSNGIDYFVTKKPILSTGIDGTDTADQTSASKTAKILFQASGT